MGETELKDLGLTQEEFDALPQEEQTKLSEELKAKAGAPPAPEDEKEKAIKGILADLQKERQEKKEFKARVEEMEDRLQVLTQALEEAGKSPETQEGLEFADEDYLNLKTARKLLEKETQMVKDELYRTVGAHLSDLESKFIAISEKDVANKYSPEKVGEELSYERVIEEGLKPLLKESPELKVAIRRSPNPAEAAYKMGLTHPDFSELLAKKKAEEIVKKLTEEKPKTGGGRGGATSGFNLEKASIDDLLKLSDQELDELARKEGE
ncbi:MAG TPA: hypothetical protein ENN27_01270 [Candidatus Atribacteria bacterium]|nr:hypothetical protein [Candidatus Atribacteria bacterium]